MESRNVESPLGRVEIDPARKLVHFVRSERPVTTAGELDDAVALFEAATQGMSRGGWTLLFDLRAAHEKNDPAVAAVIGPQRERMMRSFRGVAVLVATATDALQMHRALRADIEAGRARVFRDERDALGWLLGPSRSG